MSATKMGLGIKKEAYEADNLEQIRFTKKKGKVITGLLTGGQRFPS